MDKPHIITGVRTRRQGTPHTMVLLATELMAIASLSLTTVIRLSAPSLHPKAPLPLASGLLTPKVITLRIDASTTSRVMNRTVTTTVRHKTTRGNHKGVAPTSALRNTARDVPMITAIIARNQIGNILMAMATIVHNAIRSATKAKDTRALTKGQRTAIRSRENHIRVSRVGRRHFKSGKRIGDQRKLIVMRRTENNSKAITSILAMTLLTSEQNHLLLTNKLNLLKMQGERRRLQLHGLLLRDQSLLNEASSGPHGELITLI